MFTAVVRSALVLCLMNLLVVQGAETQVPLGLPNWIYRTWETGDGLPDNSISGVTQTDDGYIWVATPGGLLRFNGDEFLNVPVIQMPGVPSRSVRKLFRDSGSRVWLTLERGPLLRIESNSVEAFTAEDGLNPQRIMALEEDAEGGVWVAEPEVIHRIIDNRVEAIPLPEEVGARRITLLCADAARSVWLVAGVNLFCWKDDRFSLANMLPTVPEVITAGAHSGLWIVAGGYLYKLEPGGDLVEHGALPVRATPSCLYEDRQGALWIGTRTEGLFRKAGAHVEKVPTSHHGISSLFEDREGNFWVGTSGGGLNLVHPRMVGLIGRAEGLPIESVQSATEDAVGGLWVTSYRGELAHRNAQGVWEVVSATPAWTGGLATCVAADPKGGVWIGTSDDGLKHVRGGVWQTWRRAEGLPGNHVRSLLSARNGDFWLATSFPNRLVQWRNGQWQVINQTGRVGVMRAMAEGTDGVIWVGTSFGQLLRVDGDTLVYEPAIETQLTLSIRSLHVSPDGALWIGYAGDGLGQFKNGMHRQLSTASGLLDDFISQMLSDQQGGLWLLGNRGLSRVPLSQLEAVMDGSQEEVRSRVFGHEEGMPTLQPSRDYTPASWPMRDGRLGFATGSGLLVVSPDKLPHSGSLPPVVLERVTVDGQVVAAYGKYPPLQLFGTNAYLDLRQPKPELRLPPDHRQVKFQLACLSYASPENVRFRYRLSGFDNQWIESGSDRSAIYSRLAAGDYEFRVMAGNSAGVWNEAGAALTFTVTPFFWETWWFKLAGGGVTLLAGGTVVFALARRRYRRKLARLEARRALESERARIARDIHDHLGASLTRIMLLSQPPEEEEEPMVRKADPLKEIHSTAHELTQTMGGVVWAVNPEHDTFDSLVEYLTNYAHGFLNVAGIRCRLQMPLSLPPEALSAEVRHNLLLAFKEALNNVVKHAHATEVRIALDLEPSQFTLLVADNGRGLAPGVADAAGKSPGQEVHRAGHGNGLVNMKSRLAAIGGQCEWHSESGKGTSVKFVVPLKPTRPK